VVLKTQVINKVAKRKLNYDALIYCTWVNHKFNQRWLTKENANFILLMLAVAPCSLSINHALASVPHPMRVTLLKVINIRNRRREKRGRQTSRN